MTILGICAFHGDSSACLIRDGQLIAAAEEERFRRIKHWAGFPSQAIRYCLAEAGIALEEVDYVAIGRNPNANLGKKIIFTLSSRPSFTLIRDRLKNRGRVKDIMSLLGEEFQVKKDSPKSNCYHVEHHVAHMSSSFFVSPFDKAAILSIDGFGDFVSTMMGRGYGNRLEVLKSIYFPHSIGLFYSAVTQYLGFMKYGDEYKVMGLASYGKPEYLQDFREIVRGKSDGTFELDLDYFLHHSDSVDMSWDGGEPKMTEVYSPQLLKRFGPARKQGEEITQHYKNMAASVQALTEDVVFQLLNELYKKTKLENLCLAGGVALNSVANGKIFQNTPFKEIYIQSAAGDAGTSLGAAYYVYHQVLNRPRNFVMRTSYWGPSFSSGELMKAITSKKDELDQAGCAIKEIPGEDQLCSHAARAVADGKIVGWYQGRMEWGPRALGNRSIVVDPRRPEMKDLLNSRIKYREPFRPFAPSILLEATVEYFEQSYPDPFMLKVYKVKPEKRNLIPAVTHVDGTGRLQTVEKEHNPLYWKLIKEFEKITGIPVILNTSFNENEPIVCTPYEAIDCFVRTKMDVLVLGNYWIGKAEG